jgi:putative aminopeptidase FrvX
LSLRGTVSAVGSGTITVTLTNGTSITVGTDGTTTYHQQVAGTATDVASGKQVIVQLGSFDRTGTGAPGTQPSGPIGTATDVTVVSP